MIELLYYSTFVFNIVISLIIAKVIKKRITQHVKDAKKGQNLFSVLILSVGFVSGTLYFWLVIEVSEIFGLTLNSGHGEILIAAIVFNLILSLVLIPFGRVLLGRQKN